MATTFECDMIDCDNKINLKAQGIFTNILEKVQEMGWLVYKTGAHVCPDCSNVEEELQKQIDQQRNSIKQIQSNYEEWVVGQEMIETPIKYESHTEKHPSIEILPDNDDINGVPVYKCRYCNTCFERSPKGMGKVYVHEKTDHPEIYIALPRGGAGRGKRKHPKRAMHYISLNTVHWKAPENR